MTPLENWIAAKIGATDNISLRAYQLEKLRETIEHAKKNSRFYRRHLLDIEIGTIRNLEDISNIPFTSQDMIAEDPLGFVCVPPSDIERIVTLPTSGTTGPSKRIFFTNDDQDLTIDFFHHGMCTLVGEGDRVMIFLPGKTEGGVGDLLRRGLERIGCEGIIYGPVMDYTDAMRALSTGGCTCVVGLPAQLFALSRLGAGIRLKTVLLCSDYVSETIKSALETTWSCEVFSHYGMIETGLGGGVDCHAHAGYHMREADLLFEVIDPVSGLPVRDGEQGELVFTTLTRKGMPLIRYRTDDISRVITEPCACGSVLRRFERVSGRICGIITINGLKLSMPMLDEILFGVQGLVGYSAEIETGPKGCALVATVYARDTVQAVREVRERLMGDGHMKALFGDGRFELLIRQGGTEVLTYGNTKRRIVDKR